MRVLSDAGKQLLEEINAVLKKHNAAMYGYDDGLHIINTNCIPRPELELTESNINWGYDNGQVDFAKPDDFYITKQIINDGDILQNKKTKVIVRVSHINKQTLLITLSNGAHMPEERILKYFEVIKNDINKTTV